MFDQHVVLADQTRLLIRPIRPGDKRALDIGFSRLSAETQRE